MVAFLCSLIDFQRRFASKCARAYETAIPFRNKVDPLAAGHGRGADSKMLVTVEVEMHNAAFRPLLGIASLVKLTTDTMLFGPKATGVSFLSKKQLLCGHSRAGQLVQGNRL